jgi:hypothetical protein
MLFVSQADKKYLLFHYFTIFENPILRKDNSFPCGYKIEIYTKVEYFLIVDAI